MTSKKPNGRRFPIRWIVLAMLVLAPLLVREYVQQKSTEVLKDHLSKFTAEKVFDRFEESRPRFFSSTKKIFPHAVLLIHGYSGVPQEFGPLPDALEAGGIPHYAPVLTGFGLDDLRLLENATFSDWLRDAQDAFDILASMAEKVSIVGQSGGGVIATCIAAMNPVEHLVLIGPGFVNSSEDRGKREALRHPAVQTLASWAIPVFQKPTREGRSEPSDTLDAEAASQAFSYRALPTESFLQVMRLQDFGIEKLQSLQCRNLALVYGEDDLTVDNVANEDLLKSRGIEFSSRSIPNSGHNILQDYSKELAVEHIVHVLTDEGKSTVRDS